MPISIPFRSTGVDSFNGDGDDGGSTGKLVRIRTVQRDLCMYRFMVVYCSCSHVYCVFVYLTFVMRVCLVVCRKMGLMSRTPDSAAPPASWPGEGEAGRVACLPTKTTRPPSLVSAVS